MIEVYGELWFADLVYWGSQGRALAGTLLGEINYARNRSVVYDFWEQQGIYVLLHNFAPVNIGKTEGTGLGARLRQHYNNRKPRIWDSFSWYGLRKPNANTPTLDAWNPASPVGSLADSLKDLESVLVAVSPQVYNDQQPKFARALKATQVIDPTAKVATRDNRKIPLHRQPKDEEVHTALEYYRKLCHMLDKDD